MISLFESGSLYSLLYALFNAGEKIMQAIQQNNSWLERKGFDVFYKEIAKKEIVFLRSRVLQFLRFDCACILYW